MKIGCWIQFLEPLAGVRAEWHFQRTQYGRQGGLLFKYDRFLKYLFDKRENGGKHKQAVQEC